LNTCSPLDDALLQKSPIKETYSAKETLNTCSPLDDPPASSEAAGFYTTLAEPD